MLQSWLFVIETFEKKCAISISDPKLFQMLRTMVVGPLIEESTTDYCWLKKKKHSLSIFSIILEWITTSKIFRGPKSYLQHLNINFVTTLPSYVLDVLHV